MASCGQAGIHKPSRSHLSWLTSALPSISEEVVCSTGSFLLIHSQYSSMGKFRQVDETEAYTMRIVRLHRVRLAIQPCDYGLAIDMGKM